MELSPTQRSLITRVVNTFETGSPEGNYGAIARMGDGPQGRRQITYGRSQTTEYGNLKALLQEYVAKEGRYSAAMAPYLERLGRTPLVDDLPFLEVLRKAGQDPVMRETQDSFFDARYFQPALAWARSHGFREALSLLVIYDSFIHSGSILMALRRRFSERPPAQGGNEKVWITAYVTARHAWLQGHGNRYVRNSAYRTADLLREIRRNNWALSETPIYANGRPVQAQAAASTQ